MTPSAFRVASLALSACAALAGCAATVQPQAQWIDQTLGTQSRMLEGARVLVACEVFDPALRRICDDQVARDLAARGAVPVALPAGIALLNDRPLDGQLVAPAATLGAKAVLVVSMSPATTDWNPGVSVGIGGFSFGRGGGGGVGLSVPIGGGGATTGFAANGRVTDVASGRMVWTSTVVASPSSDLVAQISALSKSVLDSAQGAGLLPLQP